MRQRVALRPIRDDETKRSAAAAPRQCSPLDQTLTIAPRPPPSRYWRLPATTLYSIHVNDRVRHKWRAKQRDRLCAVSGQMHRRHCVRQSDCRQSWPTRRNAAAASRRECRRVPPAPTITPFLATTPTTPTRSPFLPTTTPPHPSIHPSDQHTHTHTPRKRRWRRPSYSPPSTPDENNSRSPDRITI